MSEPRTLGDAWAQIDALSAQHKSDEVLARSGVQAWRGWRFLGWRAVPGGVEWRAQRGRLGEVITAGSASELVRRVRAANGVQEGALLP